MSIDNADLEKMWEIVNRVLGDDSIEIAEALTQAIAYYIKQV